MAGQTQRRPPPAPPPPPPPEPGKKSLPWLWIAIGLGVVLIGAAGVAIFLPGPKPDDSTGGPTAAPSAAPTSRPASSAAPTPPPPKVTAEEEKAAKVLFDEAKAFEDQDKPDLALQKYLDLSIKYPFSALAHQAGERSVEIEKRLKDLFVKEFEAARQASEKAVAAGEVVKAIEGLRAFAATASNDMVRRRAEGEAAQLENDARKAYNEALQKADALAKEHKYSEAAELLRAASERSIEEVRTAAEKDRAALAEAGKAWGEWRARQQVEAAEESALKKVKALLPKLKARKYDEALKELEAAAKSPAYVPVAAILEGDRALAAAAASWWEAVLKGLKARAGQEAAFQTADGKWTRGKLTKILEDRLIVRIEDTDVEVPLDKLHDDQVVLLATGRGGLAEGSGETYAKAAMWFFLEGKAETSRLYLATAKELGFAADSLEKSWREGYLRAAVGGK